MSAVLFWTHWRWSCWWGSDFFFFKSKERGKSARLLHILLPHPSPQILSLYPSVLFLSHFINLASTELCRKNRCVSLALRDENIENGKGKRIYLFPLLFPTNPKNVWKVCRLSDFPSYSFKLVSFPTLKSFSLILEHFILEALYRSKVSD